MIYIKSPICQRWQYGIVMIEIIFVLVIIALTTLFAATRIPRYTLNSNVKTIQGSVQVLLDLLDRYYYSVCTDSTANLQRNTGQLTLVTPADFATRGLMTEVSYQAAVRDPFGRSAITVYTPQLQYQLNTYKTVVGYWLAEVSYTFPADLEDTTLDIYRFKLNPNLVQDRVFIWRQTVNTRTRRTGEVLSPQAEDLKRFSIQQYVPISTNVGKQASYKAYSEDYTPSYRPNLNGPAADSCEVYEMVYATQNSNNPAFQEKRAVR